MINKLKKLKVKWTLNRVAVYVGEVSMSITTNYTPF